jgi:hypothetical protein
MTHKRLISVAVIMAAVIVMSVVAVIAVMIDDIRNSPNSDAQMRRRTGKYVLAS